MKITDEMIDVCFNKINSVYGDHLSQKNFDNHWVRIYFCKALKDIYYPEIDFLEATEKIKVWILQTKRREKLKKLNEYRY